ncbi:peptidoglycan-binding protein [Oceanobacillus oncorhynchi]|uniref:peptidoglycan-binding protein n=1 Tax=Oceanobacillus oncorhynchi TaxID=545501 RepID=UPI003CC7DAA8
MQSFARATVFSTQSNSLQKGTSSAQAKKLKENLKSLGYLSLPNPNNYFGVQTEKAVKDFQRQFGLTVNGIANQTTIAKIEEVLKSPLQKGKRNASSKTLKENLKSLGYLTLSNPNNYYGVQTEKAVRAFQKDNGLAQSGIADKITLDKIKAELNKVPQKGIRTKEVKKLKEDLNRLGFTSFPNPNNYFGVQTERGVRNFQKQFGLTVNGTADQTTLNKIEEVLNSSLQRGKSNASSKQLKENLKSLGYLTLSNPNNYYGVQTENAVKAFQKDNGLTQSGIADEITLEKIKTELNKVPQKGTRTGQVKNLKENLNRLGFTSFPNPNNYFGVQTEKGVRGFQKQFGLAVNGTADQTTLNKIEEVLNSSLQRGKSNASSKQLKENLKSLGYLTLSNPNNYYGVQTENAVKAFQRDNGLAQSGIADERTLAALDEAISNRWVINHETYDVTFNQALDTQMNQLQQTDMYRNEPAYVHKNYVNGSNRTTANVNVRSSASSSSHIYGQIKKGTQVTILGSTGNWYRISYNAWRNPTRSDVSSYLNPENNDIFQHLDLTSSVGVTASSLNNDILKGKGILAGRGQAFITAGKQHSVNEIYLISHALLETGNGSSALAKGIEVGINSSGNPVVVTSSNRSSLRNIRTTYNMYGIGAVDGNAHNGGAIRAYNEGWFSPEQAIIGGARFIGNSYIHNQYNQNTLYKMRWNPANPGYPQYATDIGWAVKQVPSIKRLYDMLNNPVFKFNITQYR